jgi:flagellin
MEVRFMQINHNIRAMVTQHALYSNDNAMSKSLEKLSTGLKINRAQDDAAGLAMSEQMRTQIRGLGKAKQNSQDGIAALQIAEGGLGEITNIMQRQRELAIQAANDTLTSTERKYLNDEFQELTKEIGRIARSTDYNGKNMINWDADPNKSFGVVVSKEELAKELSAFKTETARLGGLQNQAVTGIDTAIDAAIKAINDIEKSADAGTALTKVSDISTAIDTWATGKTEAEIAVANSIKKKVEALAADGNYKTALQFLADNKGVGNASSYTLHVGPNYSTGVGGKWANEMAVTYGGLRCFSSNEGKWTVVVGATRFSVNGEVAITIASQNGATFAIDQLDNAIKSLSGTRAKIGTFINRLDFTINNIANLEYNTQDAESRIRDTDFAKETTNFTRNQIMVQASTSMLAQANSLPQSVLGLLG